MVYQNNTSFKIITSVCYYKRFGMIWYIGTILKQFVMLWQYQKSDTQKKLQKDSIAKLAKLWRKFFK